MLKVLRLINDPLPFIFPCVAVLLMTGAYITEQIPLKALTATFALSGLVFIFLSFASSLFRMDKKAAYSTISGILCLTIAILLN